MEREQIHLVEAIMNKIILCSTRFDESQLTAIRTVLMEQYATQREDDVCAVTTDWMIKSHRNDLSKVMNPDECRFIGTVNECADFIKQHFATQREAGEGHTKDDLRKMLYDVVDALDLSDSAIEKHGPLGTEPAKLVRLVLEEKDRQIAALKSGMIQIPKSNP